ncbi:MAG TPA: DMT family transporter [Actinophytocola sp.]|uniref:DMT family transporter n=1 Tax=Actinophytocola sp. TaxID=1872138 RepID=UPI002DDD377F|nr:DMT family transporter [Actinophytocola sp.]HEV2778863.1 DMT family transporter [Actinophytocola sp.]
MALAVTGVGKAIARHPSWGVAVGALCVSASAVLIDLSGTSPGTASFYRCLLAVPFLVVLAAGERRREGPPPRRQRVQAVLAGALFAGDMLLWTQAIAEVGAGLSTVLVNLQVVFVPLLAFAVDREPITRRFLGTLPFLTVGVVLTAGIVDGGTVGAEPVWGTVHAILAAVCYSGFLFLLRRGGLGGRIRQSYVDVTVAAALVSLAVGAFWHGVDLTPGWAAIGWLLLVAVAGQILGWLLVATCSPRIPSHIGAILLLLTPVGAVALGAAVLGERPGVLQLLGCALVLGSGYLATRRH